MRHKVCIDPADRACIDTSDLEQGRPLWVAFSSFLVADIIHPPGLLFCYDNGHAWFDTQEEGFSLGYRFAAEPWSSDICCCHPCGFLKRFPPLGLQGQPHLLCCSIGQVSTFFEQWWTAGHPSAPVDEDACLVP